MKLYETKNFKEIIDDAAKLDGTDFDAAQVAHKKAFNLASLWTDGKFKIPSVFEFTKAINETRTV